jgi:hypothetical protein
MRYYKIPNLPEEIDEILYDWQRAEILKRIESPIVTVTEKDPIWTELDDRLVAANNILSLSKIGEVECSIHEIIPGANAVWIMDDGLDVTEYLQAILINSQDLEALREGGLDSLVMLHLFKNF